jgi:fatty-acyl-CoA synthase
MMQLHPNTGLFQRLRDDVAFLRGAVRTLRLTTPIARQPGRTFLDVVDEVAGRHGDKPALVCDHESLTYRALVERSCRYARWALAQGLGKGDVVALMMANRPEYVAIWLGITRAGATVALLNTNLAGPALAHCIDVVAPRHAIAAADLVDTLTSSAPWRKATPLVWIHGAKSRAATGAATGAATVADGRSESCRYPRIDEMVANFDGGPLSAAERPALTIEDQALFIYTSGTTGLPKAANINHFRLMLLSLGFAGVMDARPDDRMYDCLPMHHTSGGVCAIGAMLAVGGTVVIREKFSAREFWDDVVRHRCTLFMYIGELCRYLVNSPPHPLERAHRLRLACGNGLRADVWPAFKERFAIPAIMEFYGATEGNVVLFNFEGRPGAVGRIPWYLKKTFPTAILRFDIEKEAPFRNARGFCEEAAPGEAGEAVGRIFKDPAKPASRFEGYSDAAESERKMLRDVFVPGDCWFRTGDLMRRDADGYYYFIDRIGDTYRWKGENVSTTQVGEILCSFDGILEANVYGVTVPGYDGRAGMAAVVCEPDIDLQALRSYLAARLPDYARPVFLRIRGEIEVTATFKQRKIDLVKEGFDPARIGDALYVDDPESRAFRPLDHALYRRIVAGEVRL